MSDVVEDVPVAGADGEALSKNEMKRRAKAAEKEKEKAEKAAAKAAVAAAAPPKAAGADAPKVVEEEVDPSKCVVFPASARRGLGGIIVFQPACSSLARPHPPGTLKTARSRSQSGRQLV
jgi:hypothetical protein